MAAYVRDVWSRLPALLAAATSVYGSVLKIDSTKKVCKKLQRAAANMASWATNVGNERGEIVISVLTVSESSESLQSMAEGLVKRYEEARQEPPQLLYTDRDWCSQTGPSKYQVSILFTRDHSGYNRNVEVMHCLSLCSYCSLGGMGLQRKPSNSLKICCLPCPQPPTP